MAAAATDSLDLVKRADVWHDYFESKGLDEFELIENAIAVAAWYRPDEFLERRARLMEILYARVELLPQQPPPPPLSNEEKATTISTKEPSRNKEPSRTCRSKHSTEADRHKKPIIIDINSISTQVSSSPPPVRLPKDTDNVVPSSSSSPSRPCHGKGKGFFRSPDGKHSTADYNWIIPEIYRTSTETATTKLVVEDIARDDDDDIETPTSDDLAWLQGMDEETPTSDDLAWLQGLDEELTALIETPTTDLAACYTRSVLGLEEEPPAPLIHDNQVEHPQKKPPVGAAAAAATSTTTTSTWKASKTVTAIVARHDGDRRKMMALKRKLQQRRKGKRLQGQVSIATHDQRKLVEATTRPLKKAATSTKPNTTRKVLQDNGRNLQVCKNNEKLDDDAVMEMKLAASKKRKLHQGYTQSLNDPKRIKTLEYSKDLPQSHATVTNPTTKYPSFKKKDLPDEPHSMLNNHTRNQQHMLMI